MSRFCLSLDGLDGVDSVGGWLGVDGSLTARGVMTKPTGRNTNAQNLSYSLKVNECAALSISELVSRYTGYRPNNVCPTMCRVA